MVPSFFFIFNMCMLSFFFNRKHLLMSLMSLEAMVLCASFLFFLSSDHMCSNFYLIVVLVYSVCEASLGLAVLVSMNRIFSSDMVAA